MTTHLKGISHMASALSQLQALKSAAETTAEKVNEIGEVLGEHMSPFEKAMRELESLSPSLPLRDALLAVENYLVDGKWASEEEIAPPIPLSGCSTEVLAEFAGHQPTVVAFLERGNHKIQAIKELRAVSYHGLKEAKDAVELLDSWMRSGKWVSREERRAIERDAQDAIRSILRAGGGL